MKLEPCPHLPVPDRAITHEDVRALGADRGERFYRTALSYAQSLWIAGFPARSLLLINRALSCRLPGVSLNGAARPYHAVAWILRNRPPGRFIGNPRRHFQHLATRMAGPHRELRAWRAWACWHLAKQILNEDDFPPDLLQVREEHLVKPRRAEIAQQLGRLSPCDDLPAWESALDLTGTPAPAAPDSITIRPIGAEDAGIVGRLARAIWPEVYPAIISPGQIQYMLEKMYDSRVLREEMIVRGVHYALIAEEAADIGFLAWEETASADRSAFLHKLYLLPLHHDRGIGAIALRWVEDAARARGLAALRLRVNRRNSRALRAYLRAGFTIEGELCTGIGGGFVMDDFALVKPLTAA